MFCRKLGLNKLGGYRSMYTINKETKMAERNKEGEVRRNKLHKRYVRRN
jgi:hypothetical protein